MSDHRNVQKKGCLSRQPFFLCYKILPSFLCKRVPLSLAVDNFESDLPGMVADVVNLGEVAADLFILSMHYAAPVIVYTN